jgi:hypothetical protein
MKIPITGSNPCPSVYLTLKIFLGIVTFFSHQLQHIVTPWTDNPTVWPYQTTILCPNRQSKTLTQTVNPSHVLHMPSWNFLYYLFSLLTKMYCQFGPMNWQPYCRQKYDRKFQDGIWDTRDALTVWVNTFGWRNGVFDTKW